MEALRSPQLRGSIWRLRLLRSAWEECGQKGEGVQALGPHVDGLGTWGGQQVRCELGQDTRGPRSWWRRHGEK